jgi:hypothetical protein
VPDSVSFLGAALRVLECAQAQRAAFPDPSKVICLVVWRDSGVYGFRQVSRPRLEVDNLRDELGERLVIECFP